MDIPLLKAILKRLMEMRCVDNDFVQAHTSGWKAVEADIALSDWQMLLEACGVSREDIEICANMIAQSKRGIVMWAMGLTHHAHGVDNILALSNLALSQGWLGREGAGLLPIRGHSNVQGVGTVGVSPQLKEAFAQRLGALYDMTLPTHEGLDTYASMCAAEAGRIDVAFLLGGNLYGSNPDSTWAQQALENIPLTVTVSTKLNTGHLQGRGKTSIILPALARDEEPQWTTQESMFSYVRLSEGGTPAVSGEMRSEVAMIADLAQRILPDKGFVWQELHSHQKLREAMAQVVPGLEQLARLDKTKTEFHIMGRHLNTPTFPTADGKAHFYVTPLPTLVTKEDEFLLMTIRSEGQFNTVVYEDYDFYRGNERRDVVMISEVDARRLQLSEGDRVRVTTASGQYDALTSITDISPGSLAMYYPEANVLVPQLLDPESKTPAFKSVVATLARLN